MTLPESMKGERVPIKLWTRVTEVDSGALDQLKHVAALPWVFHHVAAMPDVHQGKGSTIGSVVAMKGAVAPATVGVDVGCGMLAARTNLKATDLPDSMNEVRLAIEAAIPVGFHEHESPVSSRVLPDELERLKLIEDLKSLSPDVKDLTSKAACQLGTLGGGNHFIEVSLDSEDRVWIMLHSGSRNIGKRIADIHVGRARKMEHNRELPDKDLSVILEGSQEFQEFMRDLNWAQSYALKNRKMMLERALVAFAECVPKRCPELEETICCHHNYVSKEEHFGELVYVTRKGAISAVKGEYGIVPGSMATRSYVVRGKGNEESFRSAAHGAGRRMSRGEAKRRFTVEDVQKQTEGVECRKDRGIIDELPGAYKPIATVMRDQEDLVEEVEELRQLISIKG